MTNESTPHPAPSWPAMLIERIRPPLGERAAGNTAQGDEKQE